MLPISKYRIFTHLKNLQNTNPILLLGLQLFDALQEAFFSAVEVSGQASDKDYIRLQLRSRHLNIDLQAENGDMTQI